MEDYLINPDNNRFKEATIKAKEKIDKQTIGIMKEHTLHRCLKFYLSLDDDKQEVLIKRRFADVLLNEKIYEIQTKSFNALRDKLSEFLKEYDVTIVYPVARNKNIFLFDEMGCLIKQFKSPRHLSPFEIGSELYKIKMYLNSPNLHFMIMELEMDEIRHTVTKKRYHSKGFERENQIPRYIYAIHNGFIDLLKATVTKEPFTSREFAKMAHINPKKASVTLSCLSEYGSLNKVGKAKNAYLYEINKKIA